MKEFIILRGVSGSGKSTFANFIQSLCPPSNRCVVATADDYFMDTDYQGNSVYNFDVNKLGEAHEECRRKVDNSMAFDVPVIILANTNTSEKEFSPYLDMAKRYGYDITSLVIEHRHDGWSVHNVPDTTLQKQEQKLKSSLKLR